jgi:hypothetical protein
MDLQRITVTFEMSSEGGMGSVELDFSNRGSMQCELHKMFPQSTTVEKNNKDSSGAPPPEEVARKILQK